MPVKPFITRLLLPLLILVATQSASASPMDDWKPWVLETHIQHNCPWLMDKGNKRACVWPGKLSMRVEAKGGAFSYNVDAFKASTFIALPGNTEYWPTKVTLNGKPAPVIERNRLPFLVIPSGQHTITGIFKWSKQPTQLFIPRDVAIVSLIVDGKAQAADRRDNRLIFSSNVTESRKKTNDSLTVEVFRLLEDGVPVTMETQITLSVSGKAREVTFGTVMLPGTELLHIQSPIPARIEADGSMRAQVIPGQHVITVHSRFIKSPEFITTKKLTREWPEAEFISFKSDTSIRQAKLSGPISVDTTQIAIPPQWAELPTYRMGDGEILNIATEYRGDHTPGANELNVQRNLWLDFDGNGLTTLDRIHGEMHKDWRLNAAKDTIIGRATVDGEPVLITEDNTFQGIEIRSPSIELEAVTRTETTSGFSASGWQAQADNFNATLHLPPGWRVLHAAGVDHIWGTWISKWDLWDVFLVLIILSATRKLISTGAALLAAAAFVVALHEPESPLLIIPFLLLIVALLPVVSGRLKSLLRSSGVLISAILVLSVITFAVSTFRLAIYPSLERAQIGTYKSSYQSRNIASIQSAPRTLAKEQAGKVARESESMQFDQFLATPQKHEQNLYQVTENDRVQTGPGLPTWTWNSITFRSTGPVAANQILLIIYSSPLVTSLWRVAAVFFVVFYAAIVIVRFARLSQFKTNSPTNTSPKNSATSTAALSVVMLALLTSTVSTPSEAQDYPPKYLLDELEKRLTKTPECLPNCASLNNGQISVNDKKLTIAFDVYADADMALPLPSGHDSWSLQSVSAAEQSLPLLKQREKLFVRVSKGHHRITLNAMISGDQATINVPLPIHNLSASAPNWVVEGLIEGRLRNNTLTLSASNKTIEEKADTLKADPAPAFVSVKRQIVFGKKWTVETRVQRVAPRQGAISIPIKLIANEKPLRDMGAIANNEIIVQLGHNQREVRWISTIEPTEELALTATNASNTIEEWSFTPSSLWRLQYEGIPSVKADQNANAFEPVFKPWPGETLKIDVRKPKGVPGDIHTVESALLTVDAGSQLQRATLALQIRSSLGTNYTVTLPEQTEVLKLSLNGTLLNTPSEREIKIPLQPGSQSIEISFQSLTPINMLSRSPNVLLQDGATNVRIQYTLPRDRWPLYLNGPAIGPAMLYWGVLCVIILGAIALPHIADAMRLNIPVSVVGWLLLGLGLSTVNSYGVLIIALMFFVLAARKQRINPANMTTTRFNLMQLAIIGIVVIAALTLIAAIPMGLLSNPEMKVGGNGSSSHFYNYYQDIASADNFPTVTVISVPILAYRAVMLLWSLWLSTQLIQWASWAWRCYTEGESWKERSKVKKGKTIEDKKDS